MTPFAVFSTNTVVLLVLELLEAVRSMSAAVTWAEGVPMRGGGLVSHLCQRCRHPPSQPRKMTKERRKTTRREEYLVCGLSISGQLMVSLRHIEQHGAVSVVRNDHCLPCLLL